MTIEIRMLVWAIVLGLVHIMLAVTWATRQRGVAWNTSARDEQAEPLGTLAARLDRASKNFLETFAFFAAAVLAVVATNHANSTTALGAQLYFWARVVYLPLYAFGVPYVRTLAWTVSLIGLLMVLWPLFG